MAWRNNMKISGKKTTGHERRDPWYEEVLNLGRGEELRLAAGEGECQGGPVIETWFGDAEHHNSFIAEEKKSAGYRCIQMGEGPLERRVEVWSSKGNRRARV